MKEIIAQTLGVVAMLFNIFSYQQKSARRIIAFQLFGTLFFSISFYMLDAYVGAILNLVAFIRAILFLKKDKLHTDNVLWMVGFCAVYLGAFVMIFTVFGQEFTVPNLIIESLPVIGMVATHLAYRFDEARIVRRFGLVSACVWLIYNIIAVAVGAIACEAFGIVSIFIAMARLDKKTAE
ncbi:MAG: YgjV family protein [Oscillospiraceae bacterium]|nr:YgjV family protein [Oscillospiraceae bacterium]